MKTNNAVALAALTVCIVTSVSAIRGAAQAPPDPDQAVAALKENLAASKKRLRQYEWVETTTISLKGEEKSRQQQRAYYGADGTLTKLPIGTPSKAEGGGRGIRGRVAANKKDEMKDYMERASNLIHLYVPPSPELIQKAKDAGNMLLRPQPQGQIGLEFPNFIQPSDRLSIGINTKALLLTTLNVATYLDKPEDAVTLDVRFGTLNDGTSYTARTTLDAKAQNIRVVVENSGHRLLPQ